MDDMELIDALDRWIANDEGGVIPAALLARRGVRIIPAEQLDDAALHEQLWVVIRAMAAIGMYLGFTDHLSDRELYEHITTRILTAETFLAPEDASFGVDFDCSCEADAEAEHSFDRDRLLPTLEERAFGSVDEERIAEIEASLE